MELYSAQMKKLAPPKVGAKLRKKRTPRTIHIGISLTSTASKRFLSLPKGMASWFVSHCLTVMSDAAKLRFIKRFIFETPKAKRPAKKDKLKVRTAVALSQPAFNRLNGLPKGSRSLFISEAIESAPQHILDIYGITR